MVNSPFCNLGLVIASLYFGSSTLREWIGLICWPKLIDYVLFMVMSLNQGQFSIHHNSWCMMGLQQVKIHGTSLHSIMSKFLTIHVYVYAIQGKKSNFLF